jgi:hypothetical protein
MSQQKLHPDSQTNPPDTEYFFLGSGKIQAAIQWSRNTECTPLGIIFSMPNHFSRKSGSLLFHPELGLERTMITVIIDGIRYKVKHDDLKVCWSEFEGVPNVLATWHAGKYEILQSFYTCPDSHALIQWIGISGVQQENVEIETALYANPNIFSSFGSQDTILYDAGYNIVYLTALQPARINERYITINAQPFEKGKEAHLVYVTGTQNEKVELQKVFEREREYWKKTTHITSQTNTAIVDLYNAAKFGLRSVVASNGRFNSGIWQYGMEWGRDASMVVEGLVCSGQFEIARSVLQNILTKLTNDQGMVAEASRFRGGVNSELDSNGLVLRALHIYWHSTGDDSLIREHWKRIEAVAQYLLRSEFLDEDTGMLKSSRDIWERNEAMGIKYGYDVAHQTFGIVGLEAASALAQFIGEKEKKELWENAAKKMRTSFLFHSMHAMISDDRIIKRRLIDGQVQRKFLVDNSKESSEFFSKFVSEEMPLGKSGAHILEPDVSQCFPIIYGIVKADSETARLTMQELEKLWSQTWDGGGYGRYDFSGEPDSPGPWALATCFMAQAYFTMGENEKGVQALDWLISKAGRGGAWFEFYGDRPTPPLPPVGILPWAWAQFISMIVNTKIDSIEVTLRQRNVH